MKRMIIMLLFSIFFFNGCAQRGYNTADLNTLMRTYEGEVVSAKSIVLQDSGEGTFLGAIIGAIIGHQIGEGSGKDVATAAGAVLGGIVGSNLNKANAQELIIRLDSGEEISTIVRVDRRKNFWFRPGDKVRIFVRKSHIVKIEPIFED